MLKWGGALAAVGVVGIGLGFGGDLLLRPNTTSTSLSTATQTLTQNQTATETQTAIETQTATSTAAGPTVTQTATSTAAGPTVTQTATSTAAGPTVTQTATSTVAPPVTTISYIAPLSPQVQARVNSIFSSLIARHAGDTTSYYVWNTYTRAGRCSEILKVHLKNGILTAVEPDDTLNPNVTVEDQNWNNVVNGTLQLRPHQRWAGYRKMIYDPNRLIYPMKKVGTRGVYGDTTNTNNYVRISWDEALTTTSNAMANAINKYGPYSIYDVEQLFTVYAVVWYRCRIWRIFYILLPRASVRMRCSFEHRELFIHISNAGHFQYQTDGILGFIAN